MWRRGKKKNATCHVILRRPWAQLRMVATNHPTRARPGTQVSLLCMITFCDAVPGHILHTYITTTDMLVLCTHHKAYR